MNTLLFAHDVSFGYQEQQVLHGASFSAAGGEFLALLGVNGAGKSTFLDILAGVRSPSGGRVKLDGRDLSTFSAKQRSRKIGHLPQGVPRDLPFTVEQIVSMGRYAYAERWFESQEDRDCATGAMRRMNCLEYRERRYSTLSGGEQQRVLLAACIAQQPQILLLDEPSTYLDVHQQLQCFSVLAGLAREGALCIAVTHDLNMTLAHCSRILVLHEGRIAADVETRDAADETAWLRLLSPSLRIHRTAEGRPWVLYQ